MLSKQRQFEILKKVLLRHDASFNSIIYTSSHAVLYRYNTTWSHTDIEGNLIIYKRNNLPITKLVIFNKKNRDVFDIVLNNFEVDVIKEIIVLKMLEKCYGIWMAVSAEKEIVVGVLKSVNERVERSRNLLKKIKK